MDKKNQVYAALTPPSGQSMTFLVQNTFPCERVMRSKCRPGPDTGMPPRSARWPLSSCLSTTAGSFALSTSATSSLSTDVQHGVQSTAHLPTPCCPHSRSPSTETLTVQPGGGDPIWGLCPAVGPSQLAVYCSASYKR